MTTLPTSLQPVNLANIAYYRKDDDQGARCSRGLKVLSVKVRDIVYQKRQTSYKEVAEALINDGSFEASFPGNTVRSLEQEEQEKEGQRGAECQEESL